MGVPLGSFFTVEPCLFLGLLTGQPDAPDGTFLKFVGFISHIHLVNSR